jgi:hypothetical protein
MGGVITMGKTDKELIVEIVCSYTWCDSIYYIPVKNNYLAL